MNTLVEIWKSLKVEERKYLKAGLWVVLISGFISIFILPVIFSLPAPFSWMQFDKKGEIGELINGVSGPFIALLAAVLTFLAFYIQYIANVQQKAQFTESLKKQREESQVSEKVWRIERFENRFYELLTLHRANVDEMNVQNRVHGRECFEQMFIELKYLFVKVKDSLLTADESIRDIYLATDLKLVALAYKIMFYGISYSGELQLFTRISLPEERLYRTFKARLTELQKVFMDFMRPINDRKSLMIDGTIGGIADGRTLEIAYIPFEGHAVRLAQYYRHLFQTVKYVVDQDSSIFTEDDKYSYIKMIRAQLSNHEQLLLYYNAVTWFDGEWREYLTKYRLIKNLPLPLADFGVTPQEYFKGEILNLQRNGIHMFEWNEFANFNV